MVPNEGGPRNISYATTGGPYKGAMVVGLANRGPNDCVFGNLRFGGPDAGVFRVAAIDRSDPTLLKVEDGVMSMWIRLTPDTPIGVLVYADLLYEVNGVPGRIPLIGYRDPSCPVGDYDQCQDR